MASRAQLRAQLRRLLNDTTATPVWSDDQLNDALVAALDRYSRHWPKRAVYETLVTVGVRAYGAGQLTDVLHAYRVEFPRGTTIPFDRDAPHYTAVGDVPDDGLAQGWRWDQTLGRILLRRAPTNSTDYIRIHYAQRRVFAGDEATGAPVDAGDEDLLVTLAAEHAWTMREVDDAKRGIRAPFNPYRNRARMAIAERRGRAVIQQDDQPAR